MLCPHRSPGTRCVFPGQPGGCYHQQRSQTSRQPVEQIVQSGGELAQVFVLRIVVAQHRIARVEEPIGPRPRHPSQQEVQQWCDYPVCDVFGHALHSRCSHQLLAQLRSVAAHEMPGSQPACLWQITGLQGTPDRPRRAGESRIGEGALEDQNGGDHVDAHTAPLCTGQQQHDRQRATRRADQYQGHAVDKPAPWSASWRFLLAPANESSHPGNWMEAIRRVA